MTSQHFRATLLWWLRTSWWSVESSAPHFTWTSRTFGSNGFTPCSLTSGRLEPNTLIQPTQTEPPPDHIEFTCNEISFTGENSNTVSLRQGVSVLPVPPSITEHSGKKWVPPAPLQEPGCRVRAECWWEPWRGLAAVTQPPTCSGSSLQSFCFTVVPLSLAISHVATFPISSACRWLVQLEPACIFLCIVSSQALRTGSQPQESLPVFLFWTSCFLMLSESFLFESHWLRMPPKSVYTNTEIMPYYIHIYIILFFLFHTYSDNS